MRGVGALSGAGESVAYHCIVLFGESVVVLVVAIVISIAFASTLPTLTYHGCNNELTILSKPGRGSDLVVCLGVVHKISIYWGQCNGQ